MKNEKIVFGNLEGISKKNTSSQSEKLAELRFFEPCKTIDLFNFVENESFYINMELKKSSISNLIERTKFGCKDSFNILDLQIRNSLKIISVGRTNANKKNNSLTFDAVQNTIIKIYENILFGGFDSVETKEHFFNKSRTILKNELFDIDRPDYLDNHYTKTRLFKILENGECELNLMCDQGQKTSFLSNEIFDNENFENSEKLEKSMNNLSDTQKKIIDLYYFRGWGHESISLELNISENSSTINLSRARKKIKEFYLKE